MKRILLTTALCATLPVTAWADDILIRADLSQATVYGAGADVSRTGTAALPTGRHRLLIAMPDIFAAQLPQIVGPEAVRFGPPQVIQNHPVAEGALDTPAQATARAAVETAEQGVLDAQDALAHADASIRAIEAQQGYIAAILRGGENGVAMPQDPTLVPQFLATLGEQTARLADELLTAQMARRDLVEAVDDAQRAFAEAAQALQALAPFGLNIGVIAVDVTVPEAIEADITLDYFTYEAGWRPSYELNLETDPGALEVERFVTLQTSGTARWEDVAVTFSTSDPNRTREPSELSSTPARLIEPVPESRIASEVLGTVAPAPQTAIADMARASRMRWRPSLRSRPRWRPISMACPSATAIPRRSAWGRPDRSCCLSTASIWRWSWKTARCRAGTTPPSLSPWPRTTPASRSCPARPGSIATAP